MQRYNTYVYFTFWKLVRVSDMTYTLQPYIHIYDNMVEIHEI